MAIAYIPNTTLSSAITATQTNIPVASAASVTAGMQLVCRNEAMHVTSVDTTNNIVYVRRGSAGSIPFAAPNAALVYYATPDKWQSLRDMTQSVVGANGIFPQYLMPGARARDGAGNEFVMVDSTATMYNGVTVNISNDGNYTAAVAVGGTQGSVGVLMEKCTSDQWTWAQVYGYCAYAQDAPQDSAGTSAYLATAATSVSTPAAGLAGIAATSVGQYYINGFFIVGAATTATTAATSATGVAYPVFLNYPWTWNYRQDVSSL